MLVLATSCFQLLNNMPRCKISKQIPEPVLLLEIKRCLGNRIGPSNFKSDLRTTASFSVLF